MKRTIQSFSKISKAQKKKATPSFPSKNLLVNHKQTFSPKNQFYHHHAPLALKQFHISPRSLIVSKPLVQPFASKSLFALQKSFFSAPKNISPKLTYNHKPIINNNNLNYSVPKAIKIFNPTRRFSSNVSVRPPPLIKDSEVLVTEEIQGQPLYIDGIEESIQEKIMNTRVREKGLIPQYNEWLEAGEIEKALNLLDFMEDVGVDEYNKAMVAFANCTRAAMDPYERTFYFFNEMLVRRRIKPNLESFKILTRLFADREEAQKIVILYGRMKSGFYKVELEADQELRDLMEQAFAKEIPSEQEYYRGQVADIDAGRDPKFF